MNATNCNRPVQEKVRESRWWQISPVLNFLCKWKTVTDSLPFESSGGKKNLPAYIPKHVVLLTKCEQANGEGLSATTQMSLDEDVLVSSGFNTQTYAKCQFLWQNLSHSPLSL